MKKIIANLLIVMFILCSESAHRAWSKAPVPVEHPQNQPPVEGILKQASIKINATDPTAGTNFKGSFYPGGRGNNQLIIYTPNNGLRTGTNEFGAEAIVINNTVVQISGADTIIPRNGYVISGHGRAKTWMNENLIVGTKVFIDKSTNTLNAYLTNDSFIFATKEKIKEVDKIIKYYTENDPYYNYKNSRNFIEKAEDNLRRAEKRPNDTQKYSAEAIANANKAMQYALPYYKDELKGVWVRPTEKTPQEIEKTLDKIKGYGISNIFLETYFQGKTIFPSSTLARYNVQEQRKEFSGFDPLKIWIEQAHKRGIKVHIWFETFYAGNENPLNNPKNVLSVYPKWGNVTKAKYDSPSPVSSISEHNGYFLDPANPEVQAYLLALLEEIITTYKPDGINLDYIRYPQSISAKFLGYDLSNWGYTEYAREEFKNAMGVDPVDVKYNTPQWEAWAKYRMEKITSFVFKAKQLTSKNNIILTAVIFPDRLKSMEIKMQDWKTWSQYGYVDGFTPLILTCDRDTADYLISDIRNNSSPKTKIYPGLFVAFMNGNPDDLLRQVHQSRKLKASGVIMFDYAHLDPKYTDVLLTSAFKEVNSPARMSPVPQRPAQPQPQAKKKRGFFSKFKKK